MFKEFRTFIIRGNVIDMAVGIIVGAAFTKIVTSMVSDILMPPLGLLVGGLDFSDLAIKMTSPLSAAKTVDIRYGLFINNIVDFAIVAFCVFLLVKAVNVLKRKPVPAEPTEKNCPFCLMLIPIPA